MEHGGDLETYRGANSSPLIDFSSNINPLGIDERVAKRMRGALNQLDRYPDIRYRKLKASLGEFLRADPDSIVVGNGAMEIIASCIALFPSIYIATPCFNEYARLARGLDISVKIHATAPPFRLEIDRWIEELPKNSLAILTNPNNPTGYVIERTDLERMHRAVEERGSYLLLDETFVDFVDPSKADRFWGRNYPRLIKVQAATKSAALAGLRLGFAILPPSLVEPYKRRQLPWTVNTIASEAGCVLVELDDYFERSRRYIKEERLRLKREIDASAIGTAYPSEANFLLIHLEGIRAKTCFEFLLSRGFLVRTYDEAPLKDEFIRIAVRTKEENSRFLDAWARLERRL